MRAREVGAIVAARRSRLKSAKVPPTRQLDAGRAVLGRVAGEPRTLLRQAYRSAQRLPPHSCGLARSAGRAYPSMPALLIHTERPTQAGTDVPSCTDHGPVPAGVKQPQVCGRIGVAALAVDAAGCCACCGRSRLPRIPPITQAGEGASCQV